MWNYFIWEYEAIQKQINFNADARTNYYGDILAYFNNTLQLLKIKRSKTFTSSIFNSIGLLQVIYIHQDLMVELLFIFSLPKSHLHDKQPNRNIRNELVGHPIRKKPRTDELISSVFFGNDQDAKTIHYIRYAKNNNFKGEDVTHTVDDVLKRHATYLSKYTDQILHKIEVILGNYKLQLAAFEILLSQNPPIESILSQADQYFESVYKESYVFKRTFLPEYYKRAKEHPRYENAWQLFIKTLDHYLKGKQESIDEILSVKSFAPKRRDKVIIPEFVFEAPSLGATEHKQDDSSQHLHYHLSKLMGRHVVYGVDFFKTNIKERTINWLWKSY